MASSRRALLILALVPLLSVGALATTSASFTDTIAVDGNVAATGSLEPSTLTPGEITSGSAELTWDAAPSGGLTPEYTLTRTGLDDTDPVVVYEGADTAYADPGSIPAELRNLEISEVAAGGLHTCAIADQAVYCWGENNRGQLGDGTTSGRFTPMEVQGLPGRPLSIAAGSTHSCAITIDGTYCWGNNDDGQLGDGTDVQSETPVAVEGLPQPLHEVAPGSNYTCGLSDTDVHCWGSNTQSQLGVEGIDGSDTPVLVRGFPGTPAGLSVGSVHACAIAGEAVHCWGAGGVRLGDGTSADRAAPGPVVNLEGAPLEVAAGSHHSCAVTTQGAFCWGNNGQGQLGDGSTTNHVPVPVPVEELPGEPISIQPSGDHTCGVTTTGTYCWGFGAFGRLGNGGHQSSPTPSAVQLPAGVSATLLTAGSSHTCATTDDGVRCWGNNTQGQLGIFTPPRDASRAFPVLVTPPQGLRCAAGATLIPDTENCTLVADADYTYTLTTRIGSWDAVSESLTVTTAPTPETS